MSTYNSRAGKNVYWADERFQTCDLKQILLEENSCFSHFVSSSQLSF